MDRTARISRCLLVVAACGIAFAAEPRVSAQRGAGAPAAAPQPVPEGYMPRGYRPGKGLAPGMRITDLGKGARTFRLNFAKGDEVMSGMVEFAEKHHIKNGHFVGLGAIDRGMLGWTDTERGNAQKKLPVNEEAEMISFQGSISTNAQGVVTVHGHGAVALSNGSVIGGHIFELHVGIIAEIFVTEEEPPQ
jgi:uncharacterized protein